MVSLPFVVNILGIDYTLTKSTEKQDKNLINNNAYCDVTTKQIVIDEHWSKDSNVGDPYVYLTKIVRHEIIHAFLYESGLDECAKFDEEHFEQLVDWIAIQHEKIHKVYELLEIV